MRLVQAPTLYSVAIALLLLLTLSVAISDVAQAEAPCGAVETPCQVKSGQYYVAPPKRWDGVQPLPVFIFIHGYAATGENMMKWQSVRRVAERSGYLFVAPDGLSKTWAHQGSPSSRRNEIQYFQHILTDLERQFPIRKDRILVSGFSQGGSMAWDLGCQMGHRLHAIVPIAGGFWNPMPSSCKGAPVNILHIHGTADRTVPLQGRPIGASWHQGDITKGFDVWTKAARCGAPKTERRGRFSCQVWQNCGSGHRAELCLHEAGHSLPPGWDKELKRFLSQLRS